LAGAEFAVYREASVGGVGRGLREGEGVGGPGGRIETSAVGFLHTACYCNVPLSAPPDYRGVGAAVAAMDLEECSSKLKKIESTNRVQLEATRARTLICSLQARLSQGVG
jgi:hypothetical protein